MLLVQRGRTDITGILIFFFCNPLTEIHHCQLSGIRGVKPFCKVPAVPHKKLLVGRDGLNGVEVDVHAVLTGGQVLLPGRVRRVHVAQPVALLHIKAVNEVVKLPSGIDLRRREDRRGKESPQCNGKLASTSGNKHGKYDFWSLTASLEKEISLARVVLNQQK